MLKSWRYPVEDLRKNNVKNYRLLGVLSMLYASFSSCDAAEKCACVSAQLKEVISTRGKGAQKENKAKLKGCNASSAVHQHRVCQLLRLIPSFQRSPPVSAGYAMYGQMGKISFRGVEYSSCKFSDRIVWRVSLHRQGRSEASGYL